MSNVTFVSKISAKKVMGTIEEPKEKVFLMQVFGVATGTKSDDGQYGIWTALTGQFRAINMATGEIFQSGTCFLPDIALDLVTPMLKDNSVNGAEFAFNIGVAPADNKVGYEYVIEPLVEASENDPLELLQRKVTNLLTGPDKKGKPKAA